MDHYGHYVYYQDPAHEARTQTKGILVAFRYIFKALIYLPLLTIGYFIAAMVLTQKDPGLVWLGTILCAAFITYIILLRIKSTLLGLKAGNNPLWVVLFIFCVSVTCLMTPWLAYGPVNALFTRWGWPHWFTWAAVLMIGLLIYRRYDFLGNKAMR